MSQTTLAVVSRSFFHKREMGEGQWVGNPFRRLLGGMMFVLASLVITPVEAQPATYCVWRGTAPFCAGDCKPGEEGSERTANPPEGDSCSTGTKILCCLYPPPTPREIRSTASPNRCLDADTATIGGNGTKVQLWDCWGGQNQQWLINRHGTIVNAQSRRRLDADLGTIGANGTKVQLWDCLGGKNQNWFFNISQIGEGFPPAEISNLQGFPTNTLDADLATIGINGTKVQLWQSWNGPNQQWTDSNVFITIDQGGRCLDADLGTIGGNGTKVQLWDCLGGLNQKWQVNSDGTIVNAQSRRCLDGDLGTIGGNGTKVQLWDCLGGSNQKWKQSSLSGQPGKLKIRNVQSNTCLDGDLGTIGGNGTKVQLWQCLEGSNQVWQQQ
jgi:Ricin-type beta-trefoil lectin domain-like